MINIRCSRWLALCCIVVAGIVVTFFVIRNIMEKADKDQLSANKEWSNLRLSEDVIPTLYDLFMHPNLKTGKFKGHVTIFLNIRWPQDHIRLHAHKLDISSTKLFADNESNLEIEIADEFPFADNEYWIAELKDEIPAGKYKLYLEFNGSLTNKIVGFYQSKYRDIMGRDSQSCPKKTRVKKIDVIATTKFEPTFARQAFPCFDEPGLKAEYIITVVKPASNDYFALSNMDVDKEIPNSPERGMTSVVFKRSKKMSTYLVCFIVCDFDSLPPVNSKQGFPITLYARRGQAEDLEMARDVAVAAVDFYLDYFKVPYPLPKLDLIAIPDFVSGAMENWGLITFRETRILSNPNTTTSASRFQVALTVSHEIAHMWFGDLVTMKWWNDLWLNEGFATFMEYKALMELRKDYEGVAFRIKLYTHMDLLPGHKTEFCAKASHLLWFPLDKQCWYMYFSINDLPKNVYDNKGALFLYNELFPVFETDSALSSHPIVQTVNDPNQITEIFDSISYNKGASVLRMLDNMLGRENFANRISNYLDKYKYRNADTFEFLQELKSEEPDFNIFDVMDTWTKQKGFPVVTLHRSGQDLTITQKRFLRDPTATYSADESPYGYKWEIPLTIRTDDYTLKLVWLHKNDTPYHITLPEDVGWLKLNVNHYGYYIVNYQLDEWDRLIAVLYGNHTELPVGDRAGMMNDAFMLAEAEEIPYDVALNLTKYLKVETEYVPWVIALNNLKKIHKRIMNAGDQAPLLKYMKFLISGHSLLTWNVNDNASYNDINLQKAILSTACLIGDNVSLNQTITLFRQWLTAPDMKLAAEIAPIIYKYGVEQASENEWHTFWRIYTEEQNPYDKSQMMDGLCSTKSPALIRELLTKAKDEKFVRSQDYLHAIIIAGNNPYASDTVWKFFRENWEFLVSRYSINDRYLGSVVSYLANSFSTQEKLDELEDFFRKYPEAGAGANARRRAIETVKLNIRWRQNNVISLINWFRNATTGLINF